MSEHRALALLFSFNVLPRGSCIPVVVIDSDGFLGCYFHIEIASASRLLRNCARVLATLDQPGEHCNIYANMFNSICLRCIHCNRKKTRCERRIERRRSGA